MDISWEDMEHEHEMLRRAEIYERATAAANKAAREHEDSAQQWEAAARKRERAARRWQRVAIAAMVANVLACAWNLWQACT